jgi:hypothetical protein
MRASLLLIPAIVVLGCGSSDDTTTSTTGDTSVADVATDGTDSASTDSSADTTTTSDTTSADVPTDTAPFDANPDGGACLASDAATCDPGLGCFCCPAGGPRENCACSTKCSSNADCPPARPKCNQEAGKDGFCTTDAFVCCWGCK